MASETFRCGEFVVRVTDAGESRQRFTYRVVVRRGTNSYSTDVSGSIADFEADIRDRRSVGASVLQELISAAIDPEEFASLVVGEAKGHIRAIVLRSANRWIDAAERLGASDAESCRNDSGDIEIAGRR